MRGLLILAVFVASSFVGLGNPAALHHRRERRPWVMWVQPVPRSRLYHGGPCVKRYRHRRPICPLPAPRRRP